MIFRRRKILGLSYKHQLHNEPIISPERLKELTIRLRAGDDTVKEEIIRGHLKVALSIAGQYARLDHTKLYEIASEAIYGIIHAVDLAREKLHNDEMMPWITACCHRFAYSYLRSEKRHPNPVPLNQNSMVVDNTPLIEIKDAISISARSRMEKEIVNLRAQGYNDREVSEFLKVPEVTVFNKRHEIRKRFEALMK